MSIIKFISSIFSISSSFNKKQNQSNNSIDLAQYSNERVSCIGGGVLGFKSNYGIDGNLYTSSYMGRCGDGFTFGRNYY